MGLHLRPILPNHVCISIFMLVIYQFKVETTFNYLKKKTELIPCFAYNNSSLKNLNCKDAGKTVLVKHYFKSLHFNPAFLNKSTYLLLYLFISHTETLIKQMFIKFVEVTLGLNIY